MKPVHEIALDNAIAIELKKDGLTQRQEGHWVLRFVVQAADMDERITKAAMGTRFQAALVAIGDDELPIKSGKEAMPNPQRPTSQLDTQPQPDTDKPAGAKRDWRDVQPAAQAGIRCSEAPFWAFLNETRNYQVSNPQDAAEAVREICGVKSRVELGTKHAARVLWHQLDEEFLAWKYVDA